ncbi:macro domain-containing protein (plasmid) [Bacillus thuringiensis]|uniref:type II toxin-antitoxin system antitoxin DNA ADP-ribosyl glycohydrolase DarG n=1 Tax=Bacillus thuringiensis TaxID=1428 RepID=UPI0039779920
MIKITKGNLLEADAQALVNTVNTVGVMGKGIALQFKQAFPDNFNAYRKACKINQVHPGKMFIYKTHLLGSPEYIINFPTKRHWKNKSRIEDIKSGLISLRNEIINYNIKSIALPPLGCGNGGLDWSEVKPLIIKALEDLDTTVYLYEPSGHPDPNSMKIGTNKPKMTKARALLLLLMEQYRAPGYHLSLLEIQKLAYFLQECGEPLRLNFVKYIYGPYADNLNHVLIRLEGHYIRGYGDRNSKSEISLFKDAILEAKEFISNDKESLKRLEEVKNLIEGFETPYGMELLATVHWSIKYENNSIMDFDKIINYIHSWNERKKHVFKNNHVKKTMQHLEIFM